MAHYHCILLDADNTLLDFSAAEEKALSDTLAHFGLPGDEATKAQYREINSGLWAALERGEIKKDRIFSERFARFLRAIGAQGDSAAMNRWYLEQLGQHADVVPDAREVLRELGEVATLAVASNGVERVQLGRLEASGLRPYLDEVFVSEKMGVTKPSRRFFDLALRTLGVENRAKVLMVGDSLKADIQGAAQAGLATCWFNPTGQENETGIQPDYTIASLPELYDIVMEEEERENVGIAHRRHQV